MKKRRLTVMVLILVAILVGVVIFVYQKRDRTGPVISFGDDEITYRAGDPYDTLLTGVTAADAVDGEVAVYIENIYPLQDTGQAKVYYIASDTFENITKESRVIGYIAAAAEERTDEEEDQGNTASAEPTAAAEPAATAESAATRDPAVPVVTLTMDRVVLNIGDRFYYMDYIADLTDDIDDFDYLSTRITVNGADFSTAAAGTHEVEYIIADSGWNASEPAVLTVVVE